MELVLVQPVPFSAPPKGLAFFAQVKSTQAMIGMARNWAPTVYICESSQPFLSFIIRL
ncbi:hypothetical protein D3C75_1052180 [compost metagenome]